MGQEVGQGRGWSGADQGWDLQTTVLTCALVILEDVAWLAGESLVATKGAHRVHTVLTPAARVLVCHTFIDVCGESKAIRG